MHGKIAAIVMVAALPACGADWNPRLAADYLDSRAKAWAEWPVAASPTGGTCVSCHNGMTYLMARPLLRQALGEAEPTPYEKGLLDGLRARVEKKEAKDVYAAFAKEPLASQMVGVESILAALFLGREDGAGKAFERLWSLQKQEGKAKGAWSWFQLELDPWESTESPFYGAALAAMAVGAAPPSLREKPGAAQHIEDLMAYLRGAQDGQPLHNRLMLLWAPGVLPDAARQKLVDETLGKQQPDGGWTLASLGPWKARPAAIVSEGSNSYATAVAVLGLQQGGAPASNARLAAGVNWLKAHQDRHAGYWDAASMNKRYPAGSLQESFMRDAATGFAAMALVRADRTVYTSRQ